MTDSARGVRWSKVKFFEGQRPQKNEPTGRAYRARGSAVDTKESTPYDVL